MKKSLQKILLFFLTLLFLVVNQIPIEAYLPINSRVSIPVATQMEENDSTNLLRLSKAKLIETNKKPIAIDWKLLIDIEYKLKYYEAYEMEIETPVFTEELKAIDGEEVIIKGYVIPIDESGNFLALSANPYSSCFFCGHASPASIIGMNLKQKKHYKMDASIKFQGVLKLNYDDPEEFYYVLENAVSVK